LSKRGADQKSAVRDKLHLARGDKISLSERRVD